MGFVRTKAPTLDELNTLIHNISHRVARYLEHQSLLMCDMENTYLQLDTLDNDPLMDLRAFYHLSNCDRPTTRPQGIYLANDSRAAREATHRVYRKLQYSL